MMPNSVDPDDLAEVEAMLKSVRPYIRYFSSAKMLVDLPNEEVCIAMSWSGDYAQAMYRAQEVGKPVELAYTTPREGTLAWFDLWFIPADAPHPGQRALFLNYLLRPEVIADVSNEIRYAAPNPPGHAVRCCRKFVTIPPCTRPERCGSVCTKAFCTARRRSA